jgi:non-ribosomal peptide synthetase component F
LLRAIAADPGQPLADLPLMDDAEQRRLLVDWNDTAFPYPPADLAELFEQQAARTPNAPALIFGDEPLGYDGLNRRANQMAHWLQGLGVGPGARVRLCLERSFEQMAALLAVLKAGAAFVPLDPAYPAERLQDMLEDCGAAVVLTNLPTPLRSGDT